MTRPESLYQSPNALAPHYSKFRVGERLLLTGHSHQAWPDCGFAAGSEAWLDAAQFVDDKWDSAFEKAERVRSGFARLLDDSDDMLVPGAGYLQFRDVNQYVRSSAPNILDFSATDSINVRIGGTVEATLAANSWAFAQGGFDDVGFDWTDALKLHVKVGGTKEVTFTDGTFEPVTDNDIDRGSLTKRFKDDWLAGTQYYRDAAIHISSDDDGRLDLEADLAIDFEIGGTQEMSLMSTGLAVTNLLTAESLRAAGDAGGGALTFTITNIAAAEAGLSGGAATLGDFAAAKETGPATGLQTGWLKIYDGTSVRWVPYWA